MRALTEEPEILEPLADSERRPTVAGAADDQLMPVAHTLIAGHAATKHLGCAAHRGAVLFRCSRVAQRLVLGIVSIAYQMREQHYPVVGPALGLRRFREPPCEAEAVAFLESTDRRPARG